MERISVYSQVLRNIHITDNMEIRVRLFGLDADGVVH